MSQMNQLNTRPTISCKRKTIKLIQTTLFLLIIFFLLILFLFLFEYTILLAFVFSFPLKKSVQNSFLGRFFFYCLCMRVFCFVKKRNAKKWIFFLIKLTNFVLNIKFEKNNLSFYIISSLNIVFRKKKTTISFLSHKKCLLLFENFILFFLSRFIAF